MLRNVHSIPSLKSSSIVSMFLASSEMFIMLVGEIDISGFPERCMLVHQIFCVQSLATAGPRSQITQGSRGTAWKDFKTTTDLINFLIMLEPLLLDVLRSSNAILVDLYVAACHTRPAFTHWILCKAGWLHLRGTMLSHSVLWTLVHRVYFTFDSWLGWPMVATKREGSLLP